LCLFGTIIGYILGRISQDKGVTNSSPKSFFQKEKENTKEKVSIDDTKYVVDISTAGLEKKYSNLGEKKQSNENIKSSIDKLKNMKR
jgi:hypothetical protein